MRLVPRNAVHHFAGCGHQRDFERHLAGGVRGAAQAWVEGAHHRFHAVENALSELAALDVTACGLQYAAVHGVVVLPGGNDQVGPDHLTVLVDLVVMVEDSTRCFGLARALEAVDSSRGTHMFVEDLGVTKDLFDLFNAVEDFDQPRMVIEERAGHRSRGQLLELGQLFFRLWRAHRFDDVQARERAYAVAALRVTKWLVIGEFGVAIRLDGFANGFGETGGAHAVFDDGAIRVDEAQCAIGERDGLVFRDQAQIIRREVGKDLDLRLELVRNLFVRVQGHADAGIGFGEHGQNLVAFIGGKRLGDAAGYHPSGVNAFVAEQFDDALTEAAQADAGAAEFRVGRGETDDVAHLGIGIHAQQQVGGGEIEEAERVRLHHLRQVQHAPQLRGGMRNAHGHDGLAGLSRGDEMRDWADAADPRHEARHLVERPAFAEALEAAHLRDMKVRILDFALVVELDGDFAVSFKACDGIDGDGLAHVLQPF